MSKKIIATDDIGILELAPIPTKTHSYTPIANKDLHGLVMEQTTKEGLSLIDYEFKGTHNGDMLIATYRFESDNPELNMMLAWRNSYDKSRSAAIISGSSVYICANGLLVGDEQYVKKHIGNIDEMLLPIIQNQIGLTQQNLKYYSRKLHALF